MQCNHYCNSPHLDTLVAVQALGDDEMLDLQSDAPVKQEPPSSDFMLS